MALHYPNAPINSMITNPDIKTQIDDIVNDCVRYVEDKNRTNELTSEQKLLRATDLILVIIKEKGIYNLFPIEIKFIISVLPELIKTAVNFYHLIEYFVHKDEVNINAYVSKNDSK